MLIITVTGFSQSKLKIIKTYEAPEAIGPYSQAIESNGFVFLSGQIAIDPNSNQLVKNNIETQTRQIFKNIKAVLLEARTSLQNVVKCTVFMKDLTDFNKMNYIYEDEFKGHKPARSTVEVSRLPKDVLIEIECIAVK
ncbi:MAG: RidA family protein [Ignavibacteria bacterium]|nr:RidA family protein [Ignavibacteria bacterium]